MAICNFCGDTLPVGTGKMFIKKDGTILYFCKMKCEKNMLTLGRNPRKQGWTAGGRVEKEKRSHQKAHEKEGKKPKEEKKND
jgi:large subunit ribosomal protein L24e|tara:strand:- start:2371 stop:2616 length:246 start_codon:yes stop_codon:yes gene_type:complete